MNRAASAGGGGADETLGLGGGGTRPVESGFEFSSSSGASRDGSVGACAGSTGPSGMTLGGAAGGGSIGIGAGRTSSGEGAGGGTSSNPWGSCGSPSPADG